MKTTQKFTEALASTSTGRYYKSVAEWWDAVLTICRAFNVEVTADYPHVYNDNGRSIIALNGKISLFWTWYRMPSFNWEIICYVL